MTEPARTLPRPDDANEADPAFLRAASAWVLQWSRTLKTLRLYGSGNPTCERFRAELFAALDDLLQNWGPLCLRFTSDGTLWRDQLLNRAQPREENVGLLFFRDGIHSITLAPGIDRTELDQFLDVVLRATDRMQRSEEDLVTLLWDAELVHFDMAYVSAETTIDLDEEQDPGAPSGGREGTPMAFPFSTGEVPGCTPVAGALPSGVAAGVAPSEASRSEDWTARDPGEVLDTEFEDLLASAAAEVERFHRERAEEALVDPQDATLELFVDAFGAGLLSADRLVLAPMVERLFHDALLKGQWERARQAITLLIECQPAGGVTIADLDALAHPDSVVTAGVVAQLDRQSQADVSLFLDLVSAIGPQGLDWFLMVLFESGQQRVRRPLARAISELAADDLPRLTRWLGDPRWYVVRNVVHILRGIGGGDMVPALAGVIGHGDRRVLLEVIGALARAEPWESRPLLLRLMDTADDRVLSSALHLLSVSRDPEVAGRLVERVQQPDFAMRSVDEQRAVLSALGTTGDDSALPALLALFDPSRRPAREVEELAPGLARCIARIGSPVAIQSLESATQSRWPATRNAAKLALAARGQR